MLVNNAGVGSVASILQADVNVMQQMISLNITALHSCLARRESERFSFCHRVEVMRVINVAQKEAHRKRVFSRSDHSKRPSIENTAESCPWRR